MWLVFQGPLDGEVQVPQRSGVVSLRAGVEFHLQGQQHYKLVFERVKSLGVLQTGGDVAIPQRQGGGPGPDVLVGSRQLVAAESPDCGRRVGPGVSSGLDSLDMEEQGAQVGEDFPSLEVGGVGDCEQLLEDGLMVLGLSDGSVVVDGDGFDVSDAVIHELEGQLHVG